MTDVETLMVLSLETATRAGSIAISSGQRILAAREGDASLSHSSDLLRLVKSSLEESQLTLREIELFAASIGPGSFTGLRIGLATIKSFAATLSRPCVGVPTLEAIASQAGPSSRTLALLPAGRGELYAQQFSVDPLGTVKEVAGPATHLAPQILLDQVVAARGRLLWAGEGAHLSSEMVRERALAEGIEYIENLSEERESDTGERSLWVLSRSNSVLAESVAGQALRRYRAGQACSPEHLRALYVRASDAELKES